MPTNKSSVKKLDVEREIIRTKNMFQCVFVPFFFLDVEVVYIDLYLSDDWRSSTVALIALVTPLMV